MSSTILQNKADTKIHSPSIAWHIISIPESENSRKDIVAVIPAFNEQLVIGSVILSARKYVDRVIVVDDGSSDNTAEIARMAGADVIRLDQNTGKAYALLLGFRHAREGGCKVAVMLDADGQHDPREITRVAKPVIEGKADLVIGSRFLETKNNIPFYRQLGQKTLDLFTNMSSKSKVTDSQSGFRALSCRALDNLDFRTQGYNVESDMIDHFTSIGLNINEVPISVTYDVPLNKHKKNPFKHGIGILNRLVNLISYRRPLLVFGIPGFLLFIGGSAAEIWTIAQYYSGGVFHGYIFIGSAFVIVLGMMLGTGSLILNTLLLFIKDHKH